MFRNLLRRIFRRPPPALEAPIVRRPEHQGGDPENPLRCSATCPACKLDEQEEFGAFVDTYGAQLGSLASEHVGQETAATLVNGNPLDETVRSFRGSPLRAVIRSPRLSVDDIREALNECTFEDDFE